MSKQRIRSFLDANRPEMLAQLCQFVGIPSVSGDRENVQKALAFALDLGAAMGFHTESLLDGQVGVIEVGSGSEVLGILAHVDVVDPGERSAWRTEPFEPVIRGDAVFGRGTLDDKGPIIAALYAMKAAAAAGRPFQKKVRLILGTQEEVDWTDMRAYTAAYPPPDYGFSPDGEFPVCNIEKGSLDIDLVFPLPTAEPEGDGLWLTAIEAGTANNIVPGICTADLRERRNGSTSCRSLRATGKAVHSCQPEKGENAIFLMAEQLEQLPLCENRLLQLVFLLREKFSDLYGAPLGLYSETEYFNGEFVHRNVFSPTVLSTAPGELRVHINSRFGYGTDPHRLAAGLTALAEGLGGRRENLSVLPAVYVSSSSPFLQAFGEAYEEMTGLPNRFTLAYGGSYAKAMSNIVSWGPIFPGEEDTCHEENEYIAIKSLMGNAAVFASAIDKIVFSEKSFRPPSSAAR